jgi:putative ABC transport system ATP-binding protein
MTAEVAGRAAVEVRGLTVEYQTAGYVVRPIDGFDLDVAPGRLVLLLGPSGCGKTTLLSCLAGILEPTSGSIAVGGRDITALDAGGRTDYRRHGVGVVFQAFNLVPSLTAVENVATPLLQAGVRWRTAKPRAVELLTSMDLADRLGHRPNQLSGGQQQRVAIGRALALDPPLVLADEPTAHLDYVQVEVVLRLLRRLTEGGRSVIVSTHDDRMLALADQVVELAPRTAVTIERPPRPVSLGPGEVLFVQGAVADLAYVVEEGSVDVVRADPGGGEHVLATLGPGDPVGEMGPLFGLPRSATVRARSAARLTGYTPQGFRERLGAESLADLAARRPPA